MVNNSKRPVEPYLEVKADRVKDVCEFLRDDPELAFDYLMLRLCFYFRGL